MAIKGSIGIIADDLTGANDTALQFFMKGSKTEITLDVESDFQSASDAETRAVSTETRNKDAITSAEIVWDVASKFKEVFNVENFYKKIDSTLRGNIAVETIAMLDAIEYEAAVIAPAFIQEGRITIGGYQLLKGIPIERTDAARDTHAPIYDSYIPDILKKQINENLYEIIGTIELKTITKGALDIIKALNELIECGKKLIVMDAVSVVDMEQIALAINKSQHKILPVGSAGLANALSNVWLMDEEKKQNEILIPKMPKLILSGSKTSITSAQISNLSLDDDIDNVYFIALKLDDILKPDIPFMAQRILQNLGEDNVVVLHASKLEDEIKESSKSDKLIDEGITREDLAVKITDYIAELARTVNNKAEFVLITIGGETSYKTLKAINCNHLELSDTILPAISLCMDKSGRYIVTKSGNMGTTTALVDIINYFKHHEK